MIIQGNDPTVSPSFTLRNRVMRQLWNWTWLLLFRPSPRPCHAWRAALLRLFGARIGEHVHVYPGVRVWAPWNLDIGNRVGVADGVTIYNMDKVVIGDYCVVSQGAHLCGGSHDYQSTNFQLVAAPIVLQSHTWVCAEAFVAPGVTIAAGAVIGARSVVTRSLPDAWAVYAGMPARKIGKRTKHDT
ncbi:WcaF family extracellular polysaccharide biosynthesis acetyltransferase [Burkholderia pseudomultivorans]|uniref:WcaF family extracellular polysaccharide biosynthesis acetyltransferase n=1 Tax=Burkholderia pseudomultivorans TaxID=1207504 RepID=UPI002874FCB0|nr:WcaF family extracellular polysaccharide biosynthesis acetyltransferase [Burkholderia pseudomultivorans]MDS0791859.1 WcaF family extracellular polysaccharide biosynthesis acetyltransferase [Burkholderia pseudomultivorans]